MKKIFLFTFMIATSLISMAQDKSSSSQGKAIPAKEAIEAGSHADVILGKEIKKAQLNKPPVVIPTPEKTVGSKKAAVIPKKKATSKKKS